MPYIASTVRAFLCVSRPVVIWAGSVTAKDEREVLYYPCPLSFDEKARACAGAWLGLQKNPKIIFPVYSRRQNSPRSLGIFNMKENFFPPTVRLHVHAAFCCYPFVLASSLRLTRLPPGAFPLPISCRGLPTPGGLWKDYDRLNELKQSIRSICEHGAHI